MTIKECIDIVDNNKPNQYTIKEKVMWLTFLEQIIINEVLKTHEGYDGRYDNFEGYSEDKLSVTMIVPSPYDKLYTEYIKMMIDKENGEIARYNNSMTVYNTYMLEYRKYYNKTHLPLSVLSKKNPAPLSKANIGLSDAEYENLKKDMTYILTEYFSDSVSADKINDVVTKYMQTNAEMFKGKDGRDGVDGKDGYTPVKNVDYFDGARGLQGIQGIEGEKGDKGEDGYTPKKGVDYWTSQDKEEILEDIDADIPIETGTGTLSLQSKEWVGDEDEEPRKCLAEGLGDVSLGLGCYTNGKASIALGKLTSAPVSYATALGLRTTALGNRSTIFGNSTISAFLDAGITENSTVDEIISAWLSGKNFSLAHKDAFVYGQNCLGLGQQSLVGGIGSVTRGGTTKAHGKYVTALKDYSSAYGLSTQSVFDIIPELTGTIATEDIYNAWLTNQFNLAFATGSLTWAYNGLALGEWSQAFGFASAVKGDYGAVFGYKSIVGRCSFGAGYQNNILGEYSAGFGLKNEVSGVKSFGIGSGNIVSGSNAFAGGIDNKASGNYSLLFGSTNEATGLYDAVFGCKNIASDNGTLISGYNNTCDSKYGSVIGWDNIVNGLCTAVSGYKNTITNSPYSLIAGRDNTLENARYSNVSGNDNVVSGDYPFVFGYKNNSKGNHTGILGAYNTITSGGSYILGSYNTANASYAHILGRGLIANKSGTYIGQYNIDSSDSNLRFAIGKGIDADNRANLMEYRETADTLDIYATDVKFTHPDGTKVSVYDMANTISTMQTYIETLENKITALESKITELEEKN